MYSLRMLVLIFSVHPYCTCKFTCHVIHEHARQVIKWTMIGQLAIARALPGFNDLGRSVTPVFLFMDHFLYWFATFSENMKKMYQLEVWIFCKMHHQIPFCLALCLSVQRFQMPLEGLSFVKIWPRSLASVDSPSVFSTINPRRPCWIMWAHFSKSG